MIGQYKRKLYLMPIELLNRINTAKGHYQVETRDSITDSEFVRKLIDEALQQREAVLAEKN